MRTSWTKFLLYEALMQYFSKQFRCTLRLVSQSLNVVEDVYCVSCRTSIH
jgi:hypothetical protein